LNNRIVVLVGIHDNTTNSVTSVTDSNGNTYNKDIRGAVSSFSNAAGEIWSANVTTAGTPTITVNFTALTSGAVVAAAAAYSGISTALNAVDVSTFRFGTAANPKSGFTAMSSYANELLIGGYFDDGNGTTQISAGNGFTSRASFTNDATVEIMLEDKNSGISNLLQSEAVAVAGNIGILCVSYYPAILPVTTTSLVGTETSVNYANEMVDDGDYFIQTGSKYLIKEYKQTWTNNSDKPSFVWMGRTTYSTLLSPLLIQIYNVSTNTWETLATINNLPADIDSPYITVTQSTNVSNYYDSNFVVTFRTYQQVN
jgi:hypothetical protein